MSRYIDVDALMEKLFAKLKDGEVLYRIAPQEIDDAPTADVVEVRHGEWKFVDVLPMHGAIYECTNCKERYTNQALRMRYCPDCGAKMDGERRADNER